MGFVEFMALGWVSGGLGCSEWVEVAFRVYGESSQIQGRLGLG